MSWKKMNVRFATSKVPLVTVTSRMSTFTTPDGVKHEISDYQNVVVVNQQGPMATHPGSKHDYYLLIFPCACQSGDQIVSIIRHAALSKVGFSGGYNIQVFQG